MNYESPDNAQMENVVEMLQGTVPLCSDALAWIRSALTGSTCPVGFTQDRANNLLGSIELVTAVMVAHGSLCCCDQMRVMEVLVSAKRMLPVG